MLAVYKRELKAYFTSPVGYIYMAVIVLITGALFKVFNIDQQTSELSMYFGLSLFVYAFIIPFLTMKMFSEEKKLKTDQILLTSPIKIVSIVIGKFLSAFTVVLFTLIPSVLNVIIVALNSSDVEMPSVIGNYVSLILAAAAFIAIGLFFSVITESQVVAAVMTLALLMFLCLLPFLASMSNTAWIINASEFLSFYARHVQFSYGLFDFAAITYYLSVIVVFMFLTVRVIDKRRWS